MSKPKAPPEDPCQPSTAPLSGIRITNFAERSQSRQEDAPRERKLPPRPGPLPNAGAVEPREILNPKKTEK